MAETDRLAVDPMLPRPFRVASARRELRDTRTLRLEAAADGGGVPFSPGQFNMLYLFGVGEIPISFSGDPAKPSPVVHTIRAVGAVSTGLAALKKGAQIGLRGPFGSGWPLAEAEGADVIVIAGGIGLAPLRPAIYHLLAHRQQYGRLAILYGARSPAELLYARELERWRGRFDLEASVTVDYAAEAWRGRVGVVTELIEDLQVDPDNTVAMVCGPEIMMRFTAQELVTRGVAPETITLSMERNMKCAIGFCGHCQYGPKFVCRDGPVFGYPELEPYLLVKEV